MIDGKILIEKLIIYAVSFLGLNESDVYYKRNELLCIFGLNEPLLTKIPMADASSAVSENATDTLYKELTTYAVENLSIQSSDADKFAVRIFGVLSPLPSVVNKQFKMLRESFSSSAACNYLYNLSLKNYSIRKSEINKNSLFKYPVGQNDITVTINLSKPEFDNKEIAKQLSSSNSKRFPKCLLCPDNVGYYGNEFTPAKSNLRTIDLEFCGENWFMQYSPYAYINEHCVIINYKHTPMKTDAQTAEKMFDFIEYLPEYFIGSNAELPSIGGTVLTHEHFQGGKEDFALYHCKTLCELTSNKYPDVDFSLIDWYTGDIRISGFNRNTLISLFGEIVEAWSVYSDPSLAVYNDPINGKRHNSVTVLARFLADGRYSLDIVLRNNAEDDKAPTGIFHVPQKYLNIKKESIGLMEVLGRFVLPGRLKEEIEKICKTLTGELKLEDSINELQIHKEMIYELVEKNTLPMSNQEAEIAVRNYIGGACVEILKGVAVFKSDEAGIIGIKKFLNTIDVN